jgi:phenylalanyl-tRNA synthetase beta chain
VAALLQLGTALPAFREIPRFPPSRRDLALVLADNVPAGEVLAAIRGAAGPLAEQVELFDRFVGGSIPKDHASLAFRVVYRAADRTLTDAEVDERHAQVVSEMQRRFGAQLRAG